MDPAATSPVAAACPTRSQCCGIHHSARRIRFSGGPYAHCRQGLRGTHSRASCSGLLPKSKETSFRRKVATTFQDRVDDRSPRDPTRDVIPCAVVVHEEAHPLAAPGAVDHLPFGPRGSIVSGTHNHSVDVFSTVTMTLSSSMTTVVTGPAVLS